MSKSLRVVLLFCLGFGVVAAYFTTRPRSAPVALSSTANTTVLNEVETVFETNRALLRHLWLKDARDVVERSGNEKAKTIVDFVLENSVLSEPFINGARILEEGKGVFWFSFIPIIVGDEGVSDMWKNYYAPMSSGGVAHFQPDSRGFVVKSHIKMSPQWRGIIIIHEGRHAREYLTRQYDWTDTKTFCYEERDTHDLQNEIVQKLGGEKYRTFVNALASEMDEKLKKKGYRSGEAISHRDRNFPELDEIFGLAESELERDFRETSVWIHANFILLENSYGPEAPENKALFLKTLYVKKGLIGR